MKLYKYKLDPSSRKFKCPSCGKKRFVRYIETETGNYLEDHIGRCDRENSCQYWLRPHTSENSIIGAPLPIAQDPSFIDPEIMIKSLVAYDKNPFVNYLFNLLGEETAIKLIKRYQIGTSNSFGGSVIFWQIDDAHKIRSGKIMGYDPEFGKRIKDQFNWIHSKLNLVNFNLDQCLFGLHLLRHHDGAIGIVESEKSAVVMSGIKPHILWLATGGISNFKAALLSPLKERQITVFPDEGAYEKWSSVAEGLIKEGFDIKVSRLLQYKEYEDTGIDILDLYEREIKFKDRQTKRIFEKKNKNFAQLIEQLGLDIQ
jgi:hypothetical protein